MKSLILAAIALSLSLPAHATKSRKPASTEGEDGTVNIRCEGINAKRVKVGLEVQLDEVDRLQAITSFEGEATHVINLKDLGAPSHFYEDDAKGNVLVFGFKSFNDGLEENMSVLYVKGKPELTKLLLKDAKGNSYLAKGDVKCSTLK